MKTHRTTKLFFAMIVGCTLAAPLGAAADGISDRSLELILKPGPYYTGKGGWFIFSYAVQPQVAVWLETEQGEFLHTIFVTRKGAEKTWTAAPKSGRPEALPVWDHANHTTVDEISSATTKVGVQEIISLSDSLPAGTYHLMLETNRSYDYNEAFPRQAGVNGQPSVIYRTVLHMGSGSSETAFVPIGHGDPKGVDGAIRFDLEGIDTALQLFSDLRVIYREN